MNIRIRLQVTLPEFLNKKIKNIKNADYFPSLLFSHP